jgi:hypothetical protein
MWTHFISFFSWLQNIDLSRDISSLRQGSCSGDNEGAATRREPIPVTTHWNKDGHDGSYEPSFNQIMMVITNQQVSGLEGLPGWSRRGMRAVLTKTWKAMRRLSHSFEDVPSLNAATTFTCTDAPTVKLHDCRDTNDGWMWMWRWKNKSSFFTSYG